MTTPSRPPPTPRSSASSSAAKPANPDPLLDPAFLRKLERLSLVARRSVAGQFQGRRRGPRRGTSVELADYRDYVPGDDLRYLDWNSCARLDRLFLRLFVEEEELHVSILVDASRSMAFGEPAKFAHACRLAAALGYIALCGHDRVEAAFLGEGSRRALPPVRGRARVFSLFRFLETAAPAGPTALGAALRDYARRRPPGLALLLSDFLDPAWEEGLQALLHRRFQVAAVQVLDPRELDPDLRGDLKLVDSETGAGREVAMTATFLRRYRQAAEAFCAGIEATCRRHGAGYLRAPTDLAVEDLLLRYFRMAHLLR